MIEVISRHMESTHFNLDYSRMPAVVLQYKSSFSKDFPLLQRPLIAAINSCVSIHFLSILALASPETIKCMK